MIHLFGCNLCSRSSACISFLLILPSSVLVFFLLLIEPIRPSKQFHFCCFARSIILFIPTII